MFVETVLFEVVGLLCEILHERGKVRIRKAETEVVVENAAPEMQM